MLGFLRGPTAWDFLMGNEDSTLPDTNVCLLSSCLLRLKRIGVTSGEYDAWLAVGDALYYARRAEVTTGVPQSSLLDDLDVTMSKLVEQRWIWPKRITRNPLAKTFRGDIFMEEFFRRRYHWTYIYRTIQFHMQPTTTTNFLDVAVLKDLELYLKAKSDQIMEKAIHDKEDPDAIPLLWVAMRRGPYNDYHPQRNSNIVRLLLENGYDPGQIVKGMTVWERMMCEDLSIILKLYPKLRRKEEEICKHDANTMDIMKVMIQHGANPNIVGTHMCSLLFMATTCADISVEKRQELISLLRSKGAELFPGEAAKLRKIAGWAEAHTWPVLEEEVHAMLIARREDAQERVPERRNIVAARPIEELRGLLELEKFFTPPTSPLVEDD